MSAFNARSRNEPLAKLLTSWLVPSFSQHNLQLIVLECCLLVVVMKFQDKFASSRQSNSPNSNDKFQNNMLYQHILIWISQDFADLPEFLSSGTALNIIQTGNQKFASGDYISTVGRQKATWGFFLISSLVIPDNAHDLLRSFLKNNFLTSEITFRLLHVTDHAYWIKGGNVKRQKKILRIHL